jgi:uncharacterized Zn finger protein (UPF0148 family)
MSKAWTTCSDCGRVLYVEHGPTCPTCLDKQKAKKRKPKVRPSNTTTTDDMKKTYDDSLTGG